MEAALSKSISHPNTVATYCVELKAVPVSRSPSLFCASCLGMEQLSRHDGSSVGPDDITFKCVSVQIKPYRSINDRRGTLDPSYSLLLLCITSPPLTLMMDLCRGLSVGDVGGMVVWPWPGSL